MSGTASLFLLLAAALGADLSMPSSASARPAPCLGQSDRESDDRAASAPPAGPWDRIRQRSLAELCVELARAQIQLVARPNVALTAAAELARIWPGRPEPWVLEARAHTRLNAYAKAWISWQAALERGYDFRSAHALRSYALAAVMNGHAEIAIDAYRRLVTLLSVFPDPKDRQRLYLEASAAALRRGPTGMEEALGYLAGARPGATSTGLRAHVAGMDALIAHRRRQAPSEVERVDAGEVWYFVARLRDERPPSDWPIMPHHEACGAASLLVEKYSLAESTALWELYAKGLEQAAADGVWIELARERLARLKAEGDRTP
jgi:tetratricopeptide (TPR) repeat protein